MKIKDIDIPRLLEFTFLRKDRIGNESFASKFPHPLDYKNVKNKPDIVLPNTWVH